MILANFTINDKTQRIGDGYYPLDHMWRGRIADLSSITLAISEIYGGLEKPVYTSASVLPELFEDNWPPPTYSDIELFYTLTDESDAVSIFSGSCEINETGIEQDKISIKLTKSTNDTTIAEDRVLSGTLVEVITELAAERGLTVNSEFARDPSPPISHTLSSEKSNIDLTDDILQYTAHAGKERDGVLHLYDMDQTGEAITLSTYRAYLKPCKYGNTRQIASVKGGDYTVYGDGDYGTDEESVTVYHTGQTEIEAQLNIILGILQRGRAQINKYIDGVCPVMLDTISINDGTMYKPISFRGRIHSIIYNHNDLVMQADCVGDLT
jgi:hypothetical protein